MAEKERQNGQESNRYFNTSKFESDYFVSSFDG